MKKRDIGAALVAGALMLSAIAVPVFAVSPGTTRVVDDDGLAAVTDDGYADCTGGLAPADDPTHVFSTIQAAVTAAAPGDDIFICPGFYKETVTVATTVQIYGVNLMGQSDASCAPRSGADQSIVTGNGDYAFKLMADGVVLDGLKVANTPQGGVWTDPTHSGYQIQNNLIANNGGAGLNLAANGTLSTQVNFNCFDDNNNSGAGSGIVVNGGLSNARIHADGFMDHRAAGISVDGSTNAVSGLTVSNNRSIDDVSFLQLKSASNALIFYNFVRNSDDISTPGVAIKVFGTSSTISLRYNNVYANFTDGIAVADTASGVQLSRNHVQGTDNGINVSTTTVGGVTATRNLVKNVTNNGILVGAAASGDTFTGNRIHGINNLACRDDSSGVGTLGTANTWTNNKSSAGSFSVPTGLCPHH